MLDAPCSDEMKSLQDRVRVMVEIYEQSINKVKEAADAETHDFLARRLYDMTAEIIMSLLIIDDASRAPELFAKSANVYVRMAEANVTAHNAYIKAFEPSDLASFRAVELETDNQ